MSTVYISIGSNVERDKNIRKSLQLLIKRFNNVVCSSIYETVPVGFSGDLFYNLVVMFETDLSPEYVVAELKHIENQCGRVRSQEKYSNRSVDLDLLLYDDLILNQNKINIPREEILEYAFVLEPLAELVPDLKHPQLGISFAELWLNYEKQTDRQRRLEGMVEKFISADDAAL